MDQINARLGFVKVRLANIICISWKLKVVLNFRKIWSKFLEFESNVGDLASIIKVEKRLSLVLKEVPTF